VESGAADRERARVRNLGRVEYEPTWRAMQAFTAQRGAETPDELWLVEHPPVYTLGQAGKVEHLIAATDIPLVPIDRGGQITYHGPGQVVAYVLVDLRRRGYGIRELVSRMEQAVIDLLAAHAVTAERQAGAPGVYVAGAKIAALGLRVRHGCTYHGLAFNVDMDLAPYAAINPCGYPGMAVTQCRDLGVRLTPQQAEDALGQALLDAIYS
jgi:lipoyl(octanoyl) transferase